MSAIFLWRHPVVQDEIDEQLRHANNEVYLHWMNQAAVAHSAALGWPVSTYIQMGQCWVVRRHEIEYLRPAGPGSTIVVRTWVRTLDKASSWRAYRIQDESGRTVFARGQTLWAWINSQTGRPCRIPAEVCAAFSPLSEDPFELSS
ncbi:MAG TPA: thioesterase family protein [Candidatus Paceibacterota bacterium]|nr:thioesterase family protein [Verrucomicrobiota bacterium]HRY49211.1 thioesterase family protein [Candidatus Paceibacterota bacterium]HSA03105.1 thioesterase family protein [Candidatus Paceibacterota bacterium]